MFIYFPNPRVRAHCPDIYTVTWECTKVDVKLWGHFWSPSCLVVFASLGCKNKSATIKGVAFAIKNCFLINHLILANNKIVWKGNWSHEITFLPWSLLALKSLLRWVEKMNCQVVILSKNSCHFYSCNLNSQYFWNWTNANPMKIIGQDATASKL